MGTAFFFPFVKLLLTSSSSCAFLWKMNCPPHTLEFGGVTIRDCGLSFFFLPSLASLPVSWSIRTLFFWRYEAVWVQLQQYYLFVAELRKFCSSFFFMSLGHWLLKALFLSYEDYNLKNKITLSTKLCNIYINKDCHRNIRNKTHHYNLAFSHIGKSKHCWMN